MRAAKGGWVHDIVRLPVCWPPDCWPVSGGACRRYACWAGDARPGSKRHLVRFAPPMKWRALPYTAAGHGASRLEGHALQLVPL